MKKKKVNKYGKQIIENIKWKTKTEKKIKKMKT